MTVIGSEGSGEVMCKRDCRIGSLLITADSHSKGGVFKSNVITAVDALTLNLDCLQVLLSAIVDVCKPPSAASQADSHGITRMVGTYSLLGWAGLDPRNLKSQGSASQIALIECCGREPQHGND